MGTGGSRYGAGRPGWRRRCEQSLPLDIRRLHRIGRLSPGQTFGWHWTRDGEPIGNIGVYAGNDHLQLSYTRTPYDGKTQHMHYDVRLERTPCHYGGTRPWFRCLGCCRRCAVLYGFSRDGYFACRRCLRLGYMSESEDTLGRLWRKQRKLEALLTEDGERPKGMRQRTYARICAKLGVIEEAKDADFWATAPVLMRRLGITLDELLK